MLYIVANFKSHKTEEEAHKWLDEFKNFKLPAGKKVIICPPFTLLPLFNKFIKENLPEIYLGAQNVSPFDEGAYTGEENAKQIKEFADYVLIGHSERRQNFNETDEILAKKVEVSIKYEITPVFLVQSAENLIPNGVKIVAYEPVFAIGSGTPDTPENADKTAEEIKSGKELEILYGGSVRPENVYDFTSRQFISGVLVGGASLSAEEFIKIIQNA